MASGECRHGTHEPSGVAEQQHETQDEEDVIRPAEHMRQALAERVQERGAAARDPGRGGELEDGLGGGQGRRLGSGTPVDPDEDLGVHGSSRCA